MRSIKNRLLLKGRKNKQTIITILLALAIVVGTSNALDFCIDHKDVAIAVNKNIAGNDIPNEVTAVRETSLAIRFLKTSSLWLWPSAQPCAAPAQRVLHALGQFQVALHVIGKVGGAHRRLLRFGYFPHLALRRFLVKLIQERHSPYRLIDFCDKGT